MITVINGEGHTLTARPALDVIPVVRITDTEGCSYEVAVWRLEECLYYGCDYDGGGTDLTSHNIRDILAAIR